MRCRSSVLGSMTNRRHSGFVGKVRVADGVVKEGMGDIRRDEEGDIELVG